MGLFKFGKNSTKKAPAKKVGAKPKSKSAVAKRKKLSDFHFPKVKEKGDVKKHPYYVFEKCGENVEVLKITHNRTANKSKYKPLHKNPNPKDKRDAFIAKNPKTVNVEKLADREKGWAFCSKDKIMVDELIKKSRQPKVVDERYKGKGDRKNPSK